MRAALLIGIALLLSVPGLSQESDAALRVQLEKIHANWFKAFDSGDGAAMDQIETSNLVLVMPNGIIWPKVPRAGRQPKNEGVEHSLSNVVVRRFGDTAILTGLLATRDKNGQDKGATTVVFIKDSGVWKIASAQWTPIAK